MKILNNKGFSLIEVLAVVAILGMLVIIMVPAVNTLINKNKETNYKQIEDSIISAAKLYVSDYKYEMQVDLSTCPGTVKKVGDVDLTDSRLSVSILVSSGYLETKSKKIKNPKDGTKCLKSDSSYVNIKYNCDKKDYSYEKPVLEWENC